MKKGLIHIYHGNGKGKTTAAMGLCVRATGAELKVEIYQFLKGTVSSEASQLRKLGVSTYKDRSTTKFLFQMNEEEKRVYRETQQRLFTQAVSRSESLDLLILDELLDAIGTGVIDEKEVIGFLENKPQGLEVVLTGRNPGAQLLSLADYCTYFEAQKHPYEKGVQGRKGIEF